MLDNMLGDVNFNNAVADELKECLNLCVNVVQIPADM